MDKIAEMTADPSAPFWLKRLAAEVAEKDPVDVLNALTWLVEVYEDKVEALTQRD